MALTTDEQVSVQCDDLESLDAHSCRCGVSASSGVLVWILSSLRIASMMTAPTYVPTVKDFPTASPPYHVLSFIFLITGLQWNFQVALICTLLMAKDVEYFFKHLLALHFFL